MLRIGKEFPLKNLTFDFLNENDVKVYRRKKGQQYTMGTLLSSLVISSICWIMSIALLTFRFDENHPEPFVSNIEEFKSHKIKNKEINVISIVHTVTECIELIHTILFEIYWLSFNRIQTQVRSLTVS